MITVCLLLCALLVVGGCKTTTETITKTVTQPAATVTTTVAQPATTVTTTVTQPATTVTTTKPPTTTTTAATTTKTTTTATATTTMTTQPQVITSPDGKLQIISYQVYFTAGAVDVHGEVKNISSSTVSGVIKCEYYAAPGVLRDTQTTNVTNLSPGEIRMWGVSSTPSKDLGYSYFILSVTTK